MESRFGRRLSGVQVHTDENAALLTESADAAAFTLGNQIFFGRGRFRPDTISGNRLLAHELTHVVQQTTGRLRLPVIQRWVSRTFEALERDDEILARGLDELDRRFGDLVSGVRGTRSTAPLRDELGTDLHAIVERYVDATWQRRRHMLRHGYSPENIRSYLAVLGGALGAMRRLFTAQGSLLVESYASEQASLTQLRLRIFSRLERQAAPSEPEQQRPTPEPRSPQQRRAEQQDEHRRRLEIGPQGGGLTMSGSDIRARRLAGYEAESLAERMERLRQLQEQERRRREREHRSPEEEMGPALPQQRRAPTAAPPRQRALRAAEAAEQEELEEHIAAARERQEQTSREISELRSPAAADFGLLVEQLVRDIARRILAERLAHVARQRTSSLADFRTIRGGAAWGESRTALEAAIADVTHLRELRAQFERDREALHPLSVLTSHPPDDWRQTTERVLGEHVPESDRRALAHTIRAAVSTASDDRRNLLVATAAGSLRDWRRQQTEAIDDALGEWYERLPFLSQYASSHEVEQASDIALARSVRQAYDRVLGKMRAADRMIRTGEIHPYDLSGAVEMARNTLPPDFQSALQFRIDQHETEQLIGQLAWTAAELAITFALPTVGPILAALSGLAQTGLAFRDLMVREVVAGASLTPGEGFLGVAPPSEVEEALLAATAVLELVGLGAELRATAGLSESAVTRGLRRELAALEAEAASGAGSRATTSVSSELLGGSGRAPITGRAGAAAEAAPTPVPTQGSGVAGGAQSLRRPPGGPRPARRPPPAATEGTIRWAEPEQLEGLTHLTSDRAAARSSYHHSLGSRPDREVALYQDVQSGEYAIVDGAPLSAPHPESVDPSLAGRSWRLIEHYHPGDDLAARFATPEDFEVMLRRHPPSQPTRSRIRWLDPDTGGVRFTIIEYDPASPRPYRIRYWDGTGRARVRTFEDVPWNSGSDYRRFLNEQGIRVEVYPSPGTSGRGVPRVRSATESQGVVQRRADPDQYLVEEHQGDVHSITGDPEARYYVNVQIENGIISGDFLLVREDFPVRSVLRGREQFRAAIAHFDAVHPGGVRGFHADWGAGTNLEGFNEAYARLISDPSRFLTHDQAMLEAAWETSAGGWAREYFNTVRILDYSVADAGSAGDGVFSSVDVLFAGRQ